MNFDEELSTRVKRVEEIIYSYLPKPEDKDPAKTVIEAMGYSLSAGGKRLRPMMLIESHILCGGDGRLVAPFMAALEMIHNYSLVHDDLPAMDNDELRRGNPTTWKKYGDGMAVLAGDGLLNYSVEAACLAFEMAESPKDYELISRAIRILYHHAGIYGMIGGQCADLEAENRDDVDDETLIYIHKNKTAALIRAALTIGAVLADADNDTVTKLDRVGFCVGIAFQIQDDVLDVTSTDEELGKPVGSDEKNAKTTYVTLHGLEESRAEVDRLSREAMDILSGMGNRNEFLELLIENLIARRK